MDIQDHFRHLTLCPNDMNWTKVVSKRDLLMIINLYSKTAYANPLNPDAFPGIRKMEAEVVRMCCNLFNGDPDTSCGTVRK